MAYVPLVVDDMPSHPFSMARVSPKTIRQDAGRSEVIRRMSRRRYAREVEQVEHEIRRAFAYT